MHSDLIFNLDDFNRSLWKYGDGTVDRAAPLLQAIDGDAELDEDYSVSLSDILITCGLEMTLLALPLGKNRRTTLSVILPALSRAVARTSEPRIDDAMRNVERWTDGDDVIELRAALAECHEIRKAIPSARDLREDGNEALSGGISFSPPAPTLKMVDIVLWAIEFALYVPKPIYMEEDSYSLTPSYIVEQLDLATGYSSVEKHLLMAHIVSLSPPHALIGKGHSEGYRFS